MIPTYLKESYQLFDATLFENNIKYNLFTFWRSSSGFYFFFLHTGVFTMQGCSLYLNFCIAASGPKNKILVFTPLIKTWQLLASLHFFPYFCPLCKWRRRGPEILMYVLCGGFIEYIISTHRIIAKTMA